MNDDIIWQGLTITEIAHLLIYLFLIFNLIFIFIYYRYKYHIWNWFALLLVAIMLFFWPLIWILSYYIEKHFGKF